jgi:DNA polymerase I-like protein with 3'-5' exonuclease and polymerase domains
LAGAPFHHPRGFIVVGAVHPAFVARTGFALLPKLQAQVEQAARCLELGAPTILDVTYNYNPTDREVYEYVDYMLEQPAGGCDIETPYKTEEEDEVNIQETTKVSLIGLAATPRDCIGVSPDQFHILTRLFNPSSQRQAHRLWCYGAQTEYHFLSRLYEGTPGVQWNDAMLAYHLLWSDEISKDLGTCMAMYTRWGYHKNLEHRDPIWYNTLDTIGCLEAGENMLDELSRFPCDMRPLFASLNECVPEVLNWQHVGAPYDQEVSDRFEFMIAKALGKYEQFWASKFPLVDWGSPKQLVQLFTTMGVKVPSKKRKQKDGTFKTTPTVDEEALEKIAQGGSAIAKLIIMMRQFRKSSDFVNLATQGRFRTRARIHGQAGGRIQTVDKNVQQIPEEMLVDKNIEGSGVFPRAAIIPEHPDDCIVAADFSQIEFWLYAWYAKCQKLLDVKNKGEYLYGDFYEAIWNEPFFHAGVPRTKGNRDDSITPPWKLLVAKSWPLGFIYGRGVPDVAGLPITVQRAKSIRDTFHQAYPEIGQFHNKIMFDATKNGFLQTPFGRMRRFANPTAQRNQILAFPGQSTACDILIQKVILGAGRNIARQFGSRSRLYFTVHDSGIFNIHGGARDPRLGLQALQYIAETMSSPIPELDGFSIPCEAKIGPSWGEAMSVDKWKKKYGINDQVTAPAVRNV